MLVDEQIRYEMLYGQEFDLRLRGSIGGPDIGKWQERKATMAGCCEYGCDVVVDVMAGK